MALLFMMMWLFKDETGAPVEATEVGEVAVINFAVGNVYKKETNVIHSVALQYIFCIGLR